MNAKGASTSCGIAWINPSIDSMFAVTQYSCATGYYTFGHELGHNLGMFHDRGTEKTCSEASTFNYGYRDPNAEFRTTICQKMDVLAYNASPIQIQLTHITENRLEILNEITRSKSTVYVPVWRHFSLQ
jgi:Metallo-peptidase family M12B Reprolysin-like